MTFDPAIEALFARELILVGGGVAVQSSTFTLLLLKNQLCEWTSGLSVFVLLKEGLLCIPLIFAYVLKFRVFISPLYVMFDWFVNYVFL